MGRRKTGDTVPLEVVVANCADAEVSGTSRRGLPKYAENPFLAGVNLRLKSKRLTVRRGSELMDTDTGEIKHTEITQIVQVDKAQFVKLFVDNLKMFFELSPPGMKAVWVLIAATSEKIESDKVVLDFPAAKKLSERVGITSYSKATFQRGVTELLEKSIIAQSETTHVYFINPNVIFNGDRVRFIKEYRKAKSTAKPVKKTVVDAGLNVRPESGILDVALPYAASPHEA